MARFKLPLLAASLIVLMAACQPKTDSSSSANLSLDSYEDSLSYALGAGFADNLVQNNLDSLMNLDQVIAGIRDNLVGEDGVLLDEKEASTLINNHLRKAQMEKMGAMLKENIAKENAFLADNRMKDGVKETATGLQYKIIKPGTGAQPTMQSTVKVHYTGRFLDGKIFDSSVQRGEPIEFPVTGVIRGWTEALTMMKEGAKWELYIPFSLAYGEQGNQGIPPGSTLIFEVELISVL